MEENLITTNELCKKYSITRTTLEKYRKSKGFPFLKCNRRVYFKIEDVERWFEEYNKTVKYNYEKTSAN